MRIWLVKTGEPWPTDGAYPRLLRTGVAARRYARGGDEVIWFNGTFDHFTKKNRYTEDTVFEIEPRLLLVGLYSPGYRRNVSLARIFDHRTVAASFSRKAAVVPRPDVIVVAMPTLELAAAAVEFGKSHNIPVVVDIRDLWPDIWRDLVPAPLRPMAQKMLYPYYRMLRSIVDGSSALCGISEKAVDWALQHGTRSRNCFDGELPLAYEPPQLTEGAKAEADAFWDERKILRRNGQIIFVFFGSLSRRIDIGTVIAAAQLIPRDIQDRIRIVVCGQGNWQTSLFNVATRTPVLSAPGWVNGAQIIRLMARADAGLLPYMNTPDFLVSYPNKVFDYATGELPILTSLRGVTGQLVTERNCGWLYEEGNPDDLASIMIRLSQDREKVATARINMQTVLQQFSADHVYGAFRERLLAIIQSSKSSRFSNI